MADYNIPFKFNKRMVTDNRQYVWPIPQNKYELDRKFLNEDVAYATVDRKRKYMETAMDPATRLSWFDGVGRVNSVSMMQLYRNQQLTGATVIPKYLVSYESTQCHTILKKPVSYVLCTKKTERNNLVSRWRHTQTIVTLVHAQQTNAFNDCRSRS